MPTDIRRPLLSAGFVFGAGAKSSEMFNLPPWLLALIEELDLIPETVNFEIIRVPNPAQAVTGLQDLKIEITGCFDAEALEGESDEKTNPNP